MTVKRKVKTPARKAKDHADRLFSLIVRANGRCVECGWECSCPDFPKGHTVCCKLQCAHILSRDWAAIRTDLDNAVCLCSADHTRFTHNPDAWHAWCDVNFGADAWWALYDRAVVGVGVKVDWSVEVERLEGIARKAGVL